MEIEDEIVPNITNEERNICRTYLNAKLDIFQNNTEFLFRSPSVVPFKQSYERNLMMNESATLLSSSSDLLFYTVGGKFKNIHQSKRQLKKIFTQPSKVAQSSNQMSSQQVSDMFKELEIEIMRAKLNSDSEYRALCLYVSKPNFLTVFLANKAFATRLFNHPYMRFHPKYEEIKEVYLKAFPDE